MRYVELSVTDLENEIIAGIIVQNSKCIQPNCKNEGKRRKESCIEQEHPFVYPTKEEIKKITKAVKDMDMRAK